MNKLNLQRLDLCEIAMPLKAPFETSFGTAFNRRILIIRVSDGDGAVGYAECTAPSGPFFNHETIETAWTIISEFIAPMLGQNGVNQAADISNALA